MLVSDYINELYMSLMASGNIIVAAKHLHSRADDLAADELPWKVAYLRNDLQRACIHQL